ncbi:hypothetical protein NDU88_005367 [Pleurodeles waltl]|uniref:Uncharacterized protein n=1 Tax=Pleurodeles waltl TaxID=8319 RepID=A0AAV7MWI5_PLEWA|nr:hypothetical protein NDU88_005367 [Pleurodeles waltl]
MGRSKSAGPPQGCVIDAALSELVRKGASNDPAAFFSRFDIILEAIATSQKALEALIDPVMVDIGLMRADQKNMAEKVTEVDSVLAFTCPTFVEMKQQLQDLQYKVCTLENRAADAEEYSSCNNVWLVDLQDKVEEPSEELYLKDWFLASGGTEKFFIIFLNRKHK